MLTQSDLETWKSEIVFMDDNGDIVDEESATCARILAISPTGERLESYATLRNRSETPHPKK